MPKGDATEIAGRPAISNLERVGDLLAVDLDVDDAALLDYAVHEFNRAAWTLARAGVAFAALRERSGHGQFEDALEKRGISPQRAREAMRVAMMVASMPDDQARRIAQLPPSKAIELAKADPEVVEQLLAEGSLDGNAPLSVRELRLRLRKAEQREIDASVQLEAEQEKTKRLEQQLGASSPSIDKELAAQRDRIVYLVECIAHHTTLLGEIFEQKLSEKDWLKKKDSRDRQAVAATMYHTINGNVANQVQLLDQISRIYGIHVTGGLRPDLQYSPAEAEQLQTLREAALTASEKDFRAAEVETRKKHKTRGRHS